MVVTRLITHAGVFHADDVVCTWALRALFGNIPVIRVTNEQLAHMELREGDFVFDIGGGPFDHHGINNEAPQPRYRPNDGTQMASIGQVWQLCKPLFLSEDDWEEMDREIIADIDLHDLYGPQHPDRLSELVKALNPSWDSDTNPDDAFETAVRAVDTLLSAKIEYYNAARRAKPYYDSVKEEGIGAALIMPQFCPCHRWAKEDGYKYIIAPSNRDKGCWTATLVSRQDELPETPTAKARIGDFLAVFNSKEDAVAWAIELRNAAFAALKRR